MTQVDHHAKAVHFADNLLAKVAHSAMGSRATCAVADGIVTVMTECDIRDSATGKVLHVPDVVLDSQSVLYSKHNTFAALRLIPIEVVGRSRQSHIGILAFYNAFYLVKDAVGIVLGCHSGHFSRLGMLRQIGNHGHCVVPSVGHFVQIIEDSRVSLLEMNALGKEHRRVAMAIEGQDMAMEAFRFGEFRTATHEPLKEFQAHFFEPFGVPLHADDRFFFATFHGFDDAIGCSCRHTEPLSAVADGLMMERIDVDFRPIEVEKHASFSYSDTVRRLISVGILTVFQLRFDVLCHTTSQRKGQCLYAPANPEHGYLPVIGQSDEEQFSQVALAIDVSQGLQRLFSCPQGIVVGPAGEHNSVQNIKRIDDHMPVGNGRNNKRYAPGRYDLTIINTANGGVDVAIIGRKTNEWAMLCLGKCGINLVEIGVEMKAFVHVFHQMNC